MSPLHLTLDDRAAQDPSVAGGKAAALARLRHAGFHIPAGRVLTRDFFTPWFEALRAHDAWAGLSAPETRPAACATLQTAARTLEASPEQLAALPEADGLWAVRSSSPEEDLEGASFAGGYTTVLGVPRDGLLDAIRSCFASALDERVLTYKEQHGFDPLTPRIAVLLQHQLDPEAAGVAFSVDPHTNDYDLCAIDAAPGLGESVVAGSVTPDHFVVDTFSGEVVQATPGTAGHALRIGEGGGVQRHGLKETAGPCLTKPQAIRIAELARSVEEALGAPMDIEWAIEDGELFLLQARPITAWVPLPPSMITAPGECRRLYQDLGLSGGLTINAPLSPMGQSWMQRFATHLVSTYVGDLPRDMGPEDALWFLDGGRMYQDLSNVLWMSTPGMLGRSVRSTDALVGDILAAVDGRRYRARKRPRWLSPWVLVAYPRAVWRIRGLLKRAVRSALRPEQARRELDERVAAFRAEMAALPEAAPEDLIHDHAQRVIQHVLETTMPGLLLAIMGAGLLERLVPRRLRDHVAPLTLGFADNEVVRMGLALHALGPLMGDVSAEQAGAALQDGTAPAPLQDAWGRFVAAFGWRGPHEMDLASPRYADDPAAALKQVSRDGAFDPGAVLAHSAEARKQAWATVRAQVGWLRRPLLTWAYRLNAAFGGTRDTPKHDYLMFFAALRRSLLQEGRQLVASGRLDAPEDVLQLTLEDLRAAEDDPALDLRALTREHGAFIAQLRQVVRAFPAVIDSRGRILRPAPGPETPGELRGTPVSAGIVRGRVRVLLDPADGPLQPGEILVAHTTDPGWTPLFVHAGAVVLEVGGVLQHGAVVAREYGLPCVSGILDAIDRLQDGELVEVDGDAGVVRRLEKDGAPV